MGGMSTSALPRRYFGTDGIRGRAGLHPMTAEFAFKVGVAAAESLAVPSPTFLIGMDTRRSGPMLAHALSAGLLSRGAHVLWAGVMPTPGVAYLTRELHADAGIVVSASHNPFEDNGIKFFSREGEKLSDALEADIEARLEADVSLAPVSGSDVGSLVRYRFEENHYAKFLLANAPYLDGMRVGLDCANGAASEIAPRLFAQLGARLDVINAKPDGININVESGSTHPETIQKRVLEHGLEVGITFDGDADRALLVDRKGRLVSGDHMLAILAVTRHERRVVATVMSNLGLERYLEDHGIELLRSAVGDRYVCEKLKEHGLTLGGEQSGHVLMLDKAPTGDGILTALQTLAAVRKSGRTLEAWMDEIPSYPQILKSVCVSPENKRRLNEADEVREAIREAEAALGNEGRVNVRPSGTEPLVRIMVEGPDQALVEALAQAIAQRVEAVDQRG
jgi:phosphoglucosamine mutase